MRDTNSYSSIDAGVNGESAGYLGPYWDVQHCVETYLSDLSILGWRINRDNKAIAIFPNVCSYTLYSNLFVGI